jgi:hypothetical protein
MSEEYRGLTPTVYMVPISTDFMYTKLVIIIPVEDY